VIQKHFNYNSILVLKQIHPEDGHMSGQNMLVTITQQKYINKINVRFLVTLSMNLHFTCNICSTGCQCRQHSKMRAKKRHQVMPFYRNTLNARLSHSPLTCKFNDIPLWQKMNTELWYLHL